VKVELRDKLVLVVGASRGLGECTARAFADEKAQVVLVARTKHLLDDIVDDLQGKGTTAHAIVADATSESDVKKLAATIAQKMGVPDVIATCVGGSLLREKIEQNSAEDWSRTYAANAAAQFYIMREFLPPMMDRQSGAIFNVTSKVGVHGVAKAGVYGASKAAAIHFSETYASEAKQNGVKITTLAPGPMDTPMRWEATPHFDRKRTVDPDDVASLMVWIAAHPNVAFDTPLIPLSLMY